MKTILLFTFLFILFSVHSQVILNLTEAKKIAIENNLEYRAEKESYQTAKWDAVSSLSALLPSGSFQASQSQTKPGTSSFASGTVSNTNETNSRFLGFSFTQPLFMGGKKFLPYQISQISKKMAHYQLQNKKLEILNKVEELFYHVLEAEALWKISQDQLKLADNNLSIAQTKFEMGTISHADLLKFKADRATKATVIIQRKTLIDIAKQNFQNMLNLNESISLNPEIDSENDFFLTQLQTIPIDDIDSFLPYFVEAGIDDNLSLKTIEQSKKIATKSLLLSGGNFLPIIQASFSKNWIKTWDENENASDIDFNDSQEIGISASIPIFPLINNAADYLSAKHDQRKTYFDYEETKKSIELAIKSAVLQWISSAKAVHQAEIAQQYSEEMYAQMQERFSSGMISSTDFLDASVMLQNGNYNYSTNLFEYFQAKSALMKILSIENENELKTIFVNSREK